MRDAHNQLIVRTAVFDCSRICLNILGPDNHNTH